MCQGTHGRDGGLVQWAEWRVGSQDMVLVFGNGGDCDCHTKLWNGVFNVFSISKRKHSLALSKVES